MQVTGLQDKHYCAPGDVDAVNPLVNQFHFLCPYQFNNCYCH